MTVTDTIAVRSRSWSWPGRRRRRALLGVLAVVLAVLAGYGIWTNVSPYTLQASVEIRATPQQVWSVLTDRSAYPSWNPGMVLFTQREDFTGVAVPFYEHWLHTDTLPMFRAMDAALAREVAGRG